MTKRQQDLLFRRARPIVLALLYGCGMFLPWTRIFPASSSLSTWLVAAAELSRQGWLTFTGATEAVLVGATLLALLAAGLLTSAEAEASCAGIGASVRGWHRRVDSLVVLGLILHSIALAVLMQPAGAIFAMVTSATCVGLTAWAMQRALKPDRINPTEVSETLMHAVPIESDSGLIQRFHRVRWGTAVLTESYFWAVALCFATVGWRYNVSLLQRCVLVCFGGALIVRALMPERTPAS